MTEFYVILLYQINSLHANVIVMSPNILRLLCCAISNHQNELKLDIGHFLSNITMGNSSVFTEGLAVADVIRCG